MTAPIGALGTIGTLGLSTPTAPTPATTATGSGSPSGAGGFATALANAIGGVSGTQAGADNLAVQAATGDLSNVADYMVAAEQANVETQLTVAVRNNAVQAFQQIMGMPL